MVATPQIGRWRLATGRARCLGAVSKRCRRAAGRNAANQPYLLKRRRSTVRVRPTARPHRRWQVAVRAPGNDGELAVEGHKLPANRVGGRMWTSTLSGRGSVSPISESESTVGRRDRSCELRAEPARFAAASEQWAVVGGLAQRHAARANREANGFGSAISAKSFAGNR